VLRDRLMGVVCLGTAAVAATWGGNGVLQRASALSARATRLPVHADALGPSAAAPDISIPPAPDPSSTATTAVPSTTATTGKAAGATTTSSAPGEAPAALARRALLAQTDLPAGFVVTTPAPADGSAAGDSAFEHCGGPDAARLTAAIGARARSATFARPDTGSASSSAVVFDGPATAGRALDLMAAPVARSCLEGLINARLARNPRLSQDAKGSLGPGAAPTVGDGGVAYRFDVRLPAEDVDPGARPDDPPVRYVADLVFVRKGRTLVLAEFDNLRLPWADDALRGAITALVAHV
jgi:hypothetical protein